MFVKPSPVFQPALSVQWLLRPDLYDSQAMAKDGQAVDEPDPL
jgi:hypothetical protein